MVDKLTAKAGSDVGKVRALFCWVAAQSAGDVEGVVPQPDSEDTSPVGMLHRILVQQKENLYAVLFAKLCE